MSKRRIALTLEQKQNIATFLNENPLMSQRDVARSFSLKYNRTVSKSVVHRICLNREKANESDQPIKSKTKF